MMAKRRAVDKVRNQAAREARIAGRKPIDPVFAAWLAGMFEGEGTVTINKSGEHSRCFASLTNTDREIVDLFNDQWPGNIITPKAPKRPQHKIAFTWRISSETLVGFLEDVMPYLRTTSRRERARLVLECQRLRFTGQDLPDYAERLADYWAKVKALNRRGVEV